MRMRLSWQPIFGGGFRMSWAETLDLTMNEALDLVETLAVWRREELKAAFGKG